MRFHVEPRDVPAGEAAKRLGMSVAEFNETLPRLLGRGFPAPDPDTGRFDLTAIDRWCDARHSHLFGGGNLGARDAGTVAAERIAAMKKRGAA